MSNPDRETQNIRYRPASFGIVAAGATSSNILTTPDDAKRRVLTGFTATVQAIGIRYRIIRAGYVAADIDGSLINLAFGPYLLDLTFEPGINIEVDVFNTAAGASVAAACMLRYELLTDPPPF